MSQTAVVKQLAERIETLEQTVVTIKHDLAEFKSKPVNGQTKSPAAPADKVNQTELSNAINQVFSELGITAQAKGVAYLRQMYKDAGLENLEMSRQLTEARDE